MRPSPPDPDARRGVPKFSRDRCRGSAEFREGLAVVVEAAGLPQAVHDRPAHDALAVDHERAAHRAAAVRVEHAVRRSHRPVRPEVTQQREAELLLVRPRPQRVHRVAGHREHLGTGLGVQRQVIAQLGQLATADPAERERVEHHDHVAAAQLRQPDVLAVLVLAGEVRRLVPERRDGTLANTAHRLLRGDFGITSLVAAQSSVMLRLLVVASPAVGAASAISLASTYPSRPTLGVISQTTPPAFRSVRASTSASTRSPSSSRHHSSTTSTTSSVVSSTKSSPVRSEIASRNASSQSSSYPSSCTTVPASKPSRRAGLPRPVSPASAVTISSSVFVTYRIPNRGVRRRASMHARRVRRPSYPWRVPGARACV